MLDLGHEAWNPELISLPPSCTVLLGMLASSQEHRKRVCPPKPSQCEDKGGTSFR